MDILEKKPIEKMFPKQQLLDWGFLIVIQLF